MPVQPTEGLAIRPDRKTLSLFSTQLVKVFNTDFPGASHQPAALCLFHLHLLVSVIAFDVYRHIIGGHF